MNEGLCSGLITANSWLNTYGYLVGNLERHLPEESSVSRSIQLLATSLVSVPVDLYVFIVFKKSITIDLYDGTIIRSDL
jgi:hypothetical protein